MAFTAKSPPAQGPVVLKVIPVTDAAFASPWTNQCAPCDRESIGGVLYSVSSPGIDQPETASTNSKKKFQQSAPKLVCLSYFHDVPGIVLYLKIVQYRVLQTEPPFVLIDFE